MGQTGHRWIGWWTVGLVFLAATAHAQDDLERARTLFQEGVELSQNGQWPEAVDRFRQVLEVRATAQVKYNLAVALEHTGELVEASRLLNEIVDDRTLDTRVRRSVRQEIDAITPRLAHLTIEVQGARAGAEVSIDGEPIDESSLGTPMTMNPGQHVLALRRGSAVLSSQVVDLAEAQSQSISLNAAAPVAPREIDEELRREIHAEPQETAGHTVFEDVWFWTLAVLVLAGGGVAVGVGVAMSSGPSPTSGNLMPGLIQVALP